MATKPTRSERGHDLAALQEDDIWADGGAPCRVIEAEFGLSRTRQFELFQNGELASVLIGKRRIVARRSAREYLRRLHDQQTQGAER